MRRPSVRTVVSALVPAVVVAGVVVVLVVWSRPAGDDDGSIGAAHEEIELEGPAATRYPIVLSHHWSGTAETAFLGDDYDPATGTFRAWGVKDALEEGGAVVYQPDKVPFASHERRGRLLYKSCAGETVEERLCEGESPEPIDGVELALVDYCGDAAKHQGQYSSYDDCIDTVKINIICHSQGCPDSRYMVSAMTNELSGRPMHEHVASWTSLAGANKGTELADLGVSLVGPCEDPECGGEEVVAMLASFGFDFGGAWGPDLHESIVALSRKHMTETADVFCDPETAECPPSFNQMYPNHPDVYYQTFSGQIEWLHPCYDDYVATWEVLNDLEGANDGLISVESQRFTTAGDSPDAPPTHVVDRGLVTVEAGDPNVAHPGMAHMGLSTRQVPGLADLPCSTEDDAAFELSREAFYLDVAGELKEMGF